jgi:hypothetical protein
MSIMPITRHSGQRHPGFGTRRVGYNEIRGNREVNIHYGYRRVLADETLSEYLIFKEQWKEVFAKGFDPDEVAKLLLRTGDLVPGDGSHFAKYQRVPGMKRVRYFTIRSSIHSDLLDHDECPESTSDQDV